MLTCSLPDQHMRLLTDASGTDWGLVVTQVHEW